MPPIAPIASTNSDSNSELDLYNSILQTLYTASTEVLSKIELSSCGFTNPSLNSDNSTEVAQTHKMLTRIDHKSNTNQTSLKPDYVTRLAIRLFYSLREKYESSPTTNDNGNGNDNGSGKTGVPLHSQTSDSIPYAYVNTPGELAKRISDNININVASNGGKIVSIDVQASGLITITTVRRLLSITNNSNNSNKSSNNSSSNNDDNDNDAHTPPLNCNICNGYYKNEKALRWHQQVKHELSFTDAASEAKRTAQFAIVKYSNSGINVLKRKKSDRHDKEVDPVTATVPSYDNHTHQDLITVIFTCAKSGDLELLQTLITIITSKQPPMEMEFDSQEFDSQFYSHSRPFNPSTSLDSNGSTLLMWGCGSSHFPIVQYLIKDLKVNVNVKQKGHRGFNDRTALHWSCRASSYSCTELLIEYGVDVNARTSDGTMAVCWIGYGCGESVKEEDDSGKILELLLKSNSSEGEENENEDDTHKYGGLNKYNCNIVLWYSTGKSSLKLMQALFSNMTIKERKVNFNTINFNGHGLLHKCCQRGKFDVLSWFLTLTTTVSDDDDDDGFEIFDDLFNKDNEGNRPSDLAKIGGFGDCLELVRGEERKRGFV